MVEAKGLNVNASRSPAMASSPYISFKSTNWFKGYWVAEGWGDTQTGW